MLKKILNSKSFLVVIFIIALIMTFIMALKHEIWVDEGQAWLLSSDLNIIDIFKAMKFEAHSCLWHLILHPFARLNFPIITLNIISFLLYSISIYIILFKMKKNLLIRILIVFSPFFFYYLGTISRCYCLIPPFLCFIYLIYDKRQEHPFIYANLLGLLANTHVVIDGLVGMMALLFIIEMFKEHKTDSKKKILKVLGIFFGYFLFLSLQIIPSFNNCHIFNYSNNGNQIVEMIHKVLFNYLDINNKASAVLIIILTLSIIFTFMDNLKKGLVYSSFIIFFVIIHLTWPFILTERISIFLFVFLIINIDTNKIYLKMLMLLLLISSMISLIKVPWDDYFNRYSDSLNAASFMNKKLKKNTVIVFVNSVRHSSFAAYINKNVDYYNLNTNKKSRYIIWNESQSKMMNNEKIKKSLAKLSKKYKKIYLVVSDYYYSKQFIQIYYESGQYVALEYEGILNNVYLTDNTSNVVSKNLESYAIYEYIGNSS